jgi:hypothetical protein
VLVCIYVGLSEGWGRGCGDGRYPHTLTKSFYIPQPYTGYTKKLVIDVDVQLRILNPDGS